MTDKIVFNQLAIEVTRRCNMTCAHCLRGDAQDLDIALYDIDWVLMQTEAIGRLVITGGEPTLNLEAVKYVANAIAQRGIPVMRVQIITNGYKYDDEFVNIIKRFAEIVRLTQKHGYGNDKSEPWRVQVGVSLDRYHANGEVCRKNYIKYKNNLRGIAEVLRISRGNAPRNVGRATRLPDTDTIDYSFTASSYLAQRIEVLSADHKPMCRFFDGYHLAREDQKVVCCGIYLNARGEVLPGLACDREYDDCMPVCLAIEPIWENILGYNTKYDRLPCTRCDDYRIKDMLCQPEDQRQRENALTMAKEAGDEPSYEPIYIGDVRKVRKWFVPDAFKKIERAAKRKDYLNKV